MAIDRPKTLRRLLSVSAYTLSFVIFVALLPISLSFALALDLLARSRLALVRTVLMVLVYLAFELLGIAAATVLWCRGGDPERYLDAHYRLQWWWAGTLFDVVRALFGLHVTVDGADCATPGPVLVFARHVSIADTLLAAAILSRPFGLRLRYVLKHELLWDPCLDIVGHRLPNAFVRRGSRDTAGDIAAVRALARGLGPRDGVLIFPEGTRATERARARVIAHLEASPGTTPEQLARARELLHVLPPRLEGALALLDEAPEADVVFVAHVGFERVRSLLDLRRGELVGAEAHVLLWRRPRSEVPGDRAGREHWLATQWKHMDERVAALLALTEKKRAR
jgi:1-acyl-sn-glycerol-3-phosphate acyltransferase